MKKHPLTLTISGPVASGKTTLAHLIGNLLQPHHKIRIFDGTNSPPKGETPVLQQATRFTATRKINIHVEQAGERTCVHCGCTDSRACPGGCSWLETHLATPTGVCSQCATLESFPEGTLLERKFADGSKTWILRHSTTPTPPEPPQGNADLHDLSYRFAQDTRKQRKPRTKR